MQQARPHSGGAPRAAAGPLPGNHAQHWASGVPALNCVYVCALTRFICTPLARRVPKGSETSKRGHSGDLGTLKKFSMQVKGNCFFASCHPASGTLSQKQQQGSREPLPQARRTPRVHQRSNFTRCAAGEHKPWKTQGRHGTAVIPPPENEEQVGSLCYTVH